MHTLQVNKNEATAARRRVYFFCVDATDGITPETGEASGQPEISIDGAAWTSAGSVIGTLTAIGNGRYYAELSQAAVNLDRGIIQTRYKSAATAEAVGSTVQIGMNLTEIDGALTNGNNATLNLKQLNIVNSAGDAVVASSTGSNGHGINATGNGSGSGVKGAGGATGNGLWGLGGATSGQGIVGQGQGTGSGILGAAGSTGSGIRGSASSGDNPGISGAGYGTGAGIYGVGGATGHGATFNGGATNGHGIYAISPTSGNGFHAQGKGAYHGIYAVGGATGNGVYLLGGSTSGSGLKASVQTAGHGIDAIGAGGAYCGINATAGSTGDGIRSTGGATSGHGISAIAGLAGDGISAIAVGAGKNGITAYGPDGYGLKATSGAGVGYAGIYAAGGASGDGMLLDGGAAGDDLKLATADTNLDDAILAVLGTPVAATIAEDIANVGGIVSEGVPHYYAPNNADAPTVGNVEAGAITDLAAQDDAYYQVGESAAGTFLEQLIGISASLVDHTPSYVSVVGFYNGSTTGHGIQVYAYDYDLAAFEATPRLTMLHRTAEYAYAFPVDVSNHDPATGAMLLKFVHTASASGNASHYLRLNKVEWSKVESTNQSAAEISAILSMVNDIDLEVDELVEEVLPRVEVAIADVPNTVWDEAIGDHIAAGSTGEALAAAQSGLADPSGIAAAVWDVTLADHIDAGSTGEKLDEGTATDISDLPTNAELAAALADLATTAEVTAATAPLATTGEVAAAVAPLALQASVDTVEASLTSISATVDALPTLAEILLGQPAGWVELTHLTAGLSVAEADGNPTEGIAIVVYLESDIHRTDPIAVTQSQVDGEFSVFVPPSADYTLVFTLDGYLPSTVNVTVA